MLRNATRELRRAAWTPYDAAPMRLARSLAHSAPPRVSSEQTPDISNSHEPRRVGNGSFANRFERIVPRTHLKSHEATYLYDEAFVRSFEDSDFDTDLGQYGSESRDSETIIKASGEPDSQARPKRRQPDRLDNEVFAKKFLELGPGAKVHGYAEKIKELESYARSVSRSWTDIQPPRSARQKAYPSETQSTVVPFRAIFTQKDRNDDARRVIAMSRSTRLRDVLMQMQVRSEVEAAENDDGNDLRNLLSSDEEWAETMEAMHYLGHTSDDLEYYLYILRGDTDELRCKRFLERDTFKPMLILNFVLRQSSSIIEVPTLLGLMRYCHKWFCIVEDVKVATLPAPEKLFIRYWGPTTHNFRFIISMLSYHWQRIEPRLLVELAEVAAVYIQNLARRQGHPEKIYAAQCHILNAALAELQPKRDLLVPHRSLPNPYFWESQRILLHMSDNLERPLLVNQEGFRAIRNVLAGLPKNLSEVHNARLHASTWPPYLQPGDGMDERMEPEDSWSRVVRAGVMMQETGFPLDESDEALNILQGLASDGTPTIQRRMVAGTRKKWGPWAASIRATRNAHEAWGKFQHMQRYGQSPGVNEYTAMFEKLYAREADLEPGIAPGDNSLNLPVHGETNLTEFEKARLRPPSVEELYQKMRRNGIPPSGHCLRLLISNAESLGTAHRYLLDSDKPWSQYSGLLSEEPDDMQLKDTPMNLFAAYIDVCSRETKPAGYHLRRAIRLTEARLARLQQRTYWHSFLWSPILKQIGRHHTALGLRLSEQLQVLSDILERMQGQGGISVSLLCQTSRCVQKIARREVTNLLEGLKSNENLSRNSLNLLYDMEARQARHELEGHTLPALFHRVATQMKQAFKDLVVREREIRDAIRPNNISAIDTILSRQDPVRASRAYEYVLSLAYVGEFEEMAEALKWLMEEWGRQEIMEEMEKLDELPREVDMVDTLCAFRAFAEPMLPPEVISSVHETLDATQVGWPWPDDEVVETYLQGRQEDDPRAELRSMLLWARYRQKQQRHDDNGGADVDEKEFSMPGDGLDG